MAWLRLMRSWLVCLLNLWVSSGRKWQRSRQSWKWKEQLCQLTYPLTCVFGSKKLFKIRFTTGRWHGKSPCFSEVPFLRSLGPDYPLLILPCVDGASKHGVCILLWKEAESVFKTKKEVQSKRQDRSFEIQPTATQTNFRANRRSKTNFPHNFCRFERFFQF